MIHKWDGKYDETWRRTVLHKAKKNITVSKTTGQFTNFYLANSIKIQLTWRNISKHT